MPLESERLAVQLHFKCVFADFDRHISIVHLLVVVGAERHDFRGRE